MPSRPLRLFPVSGRTTRWQVSWLADLCFRAAFPERLGSSGIMAFSSWLTVAGTAPDFHRLPSWPPVGRHHLVASNVASAKKCQQRADGIGATGGVQKSIPRCALMPALKGCFTSRISLTRSA